MIKRPQNLKSTDMKKLFILTAVIGTSLIATKSYSQVYIGAHVGFRVPAPRVYVGATVPVYAPAPAPVYEPAPGPEYEQPAPAYGGYYAAPTVCEADYPGYAYYDYPAYYGHYRDRVYFEHYRPFFYRDHAAYFYHGGFDHARWANDHGFGYRGGYGYHGGGWHGGGEGHRGRW